MGQVSVPSTGGINVAPVDREAGPGAGAGASGSRDIFLGLNAGKNTTQNDVIVIGNAALSAGVSDANSAGSTIVGSQSVKLVTSLSTTDNNGLSTAGPLTLIGSNILPDAVNFGGSVALGDNMGPGLTPLVNRTGAMVMIGSGVAQNVTRVSINFSTSVLIGYNAYRCSSAVTNQDIVDCVIIGSRACDTGGPAGAGTFQNNVVIGTRAARSLAVSSANVIIGTAAGSNASSLTNSVCIGDSANLFGTGTRQVIIGASASSTSSDTTILGAGAVGGSTCTGSIIIGSGAGSAGGTTFAADQFMVETNYGGTLRALLFGNLGTGNIVLGQSTQGTNRDFVSAAANSNQTKLLNGLRGAGNPVGGGFFYVNAGALHWVGSAGTDTPVAPA